MRDIRNHLRPALLAISLAAVNWHLGRGGRTAVLWRWLEWRRTGWMMGPGMMGGWMGRG